MRFLRFHFGLVVLLQMTSTGYGENNAGNLRQCLRSCEGAQRCPSRSDIPVFLRTLPARCTQCITDACGRTPEGLCLGPTYNACPACPGLSLNQQLQQKRCRNCVKTCYKQSGARVPRRQRKTFREYGCLLDCRLNAMCPDEEIEAKIRENLPETCGRCLGHVCERNQSSDVRNDFSCIECLSIQLKDQGRWETCGSCIDRCFSGPIKHPFARFSCMKNCEGLRSCPSRNWYANRVQGFSQPCLRCIRKECGKFDSSNPAEIAEIPDCIEEAFLECYNCPPYSYEEQSRLKSCKFCLNNCSLDTRSYR
ncbi:uncharacterized protein LOC143462730 [Clavelina lepadiformis]|uniref:uncharacterized protein LOC143462730 n=1 Tax=Clavelina lepadiformis TaxID=159417 RepID=UPI00404157E4